MLINWSQRDEVYIGRYFIYDDSLGHRDVFGSVHILQGLQI